MQAIRTRPLIVAVSVLFAVAIAWVFFYHECATGGAMGGRYRECTCRGIEQLDYDNTAFDGAIRTVCFGWVTARTCYQDRGGFEIACNEINQ